MATVYKVKLKIVSAFCAYSSSQIKEKILKALNEYRFKHDPKNGLDLRVADIEVIQE